MSSKQKKVSRKRYRLIHFSILGSRIVFENRAIDGTHIPAFIFMEDQPRYRNRKGVLSQNVLAVVDFDMNFQYVLAGWESSASDSRWNWEDAYFEEHMEKEIEDSHNLDDIDSDSDDEELGRGRTNIDKQYMCNLKDGIAHQIWCARSIR
ncbi:PREDICTED: uncharacterized protein LOC109219584 [Nicotiana attenuata]|uniref:uncharacterized protein LOC109219584 n=1 Tax=Nicotiana attenuata TaxID=49451 RepID=UPI0009054643|nr:PREDICTED: uncharacterized protein LOC109219584 [Nicotiana attenuata]